MALRSILIHPDPRLKRPSEAVETVDDEARALIDDMFETMYAAPGIGLAAPQVGVNKRIFVMDCAIRDAEERATEEDLAAAASVAPCPIAFVNPEVVWRSEETRVYNEGCLSIPDQFDDVRRPTEVKMRWLDRDGAAQEQHFTGLAAVCAQHEFDHLEGKLFIDYLGPVRRTLITEKMKKLKRERAKEKARRKADVKR